MAREEIPERKDITPGDKWDLSPLFKSPDQWETLYKNLENEIDKYNSFRGKMHESVDIFLEAIEFDLSISRNLEKLYVYAHLKSDQDKSNQHNLGLHQRSMNLYTRISELSSFITPEIQSLPDKIIKEYLKDKRLKDYSFLLEKILRLKPHTLSLEIEQVLAMSSEMAAAPSEIFSQLDNVDLKFGTVKDEKGKEVELSHGNFSTFLINPSREVRKNVFKQYYSAYNSHKHTISAALPYSIKKDSFYSKVRKFESTIQSALFSDNVPVKVYDNLIDTVKQNLPPLFKYFDFRKKILGLDELHFYDTYVPIVPEVDFKMPYEEAVDICVNALSPLGEEYTAILREGLLGGWVDRFENKGKRSGAYSSGCYDSPPYILMNYEDRNINSIYTLIHEAGHSMHSYYSKKNQPYHNHSYTIFVAEVASTFNETLLSSHLIKHYKNDKKMVTFILNREIDNIRSTLYRQTMFAEFEKITHNIIKRNEPLTLDVLTDTYKTLLETYFGNTMVIDDELHLECLRIPHFYSSFYVYKYATGICAAIALAKEVLNESSKGEDSNSKNTYIDFLKMGGSKFPIDELKTAGVDMNSPKPVKDALEHFSKLVDELAESF
ncbi:oligoendopeptidase F [Spirochaetota bacterium]